MSNIINIKEVILRFSLIALLMLCFVSNSSTSLANEVLTLTSIDQYLANEEAKFDDLVPNIERSIRWFDGIKKTDLSIIYLHGFSASSKELSPTVELLADQLQANIYYTRLTGHGRSEDAMVDGNTEAWFDDTKLAYEVGVLIGKKVIIVSASTGGTLATWLVSQTFADKLLTNIMVSPNYGIKNLFGRTLQWPLGLRFAKWINGPYYSFEPLNEMHKQYWTERYPVEAIPPMLELINIIDEIDKSLISLPQMVIFSPDDQVIDVSKIEYNIKQFKNSKVTVERYKNSTDPYQHVLAGDACSPESTDEVVNLMSAYVKSLLN